MQIKKRFNVILHLKFYVNTLDLTNKHDKTLNLQKTTKYFVLNTFY